MKRHFPTDCSSSTICIANRHNEVAILIPIARRGFFKTLEVGKIVMRSRSIVTQLVIQYVSLVDTEKRYEIVLHELIFPIAKVISINLISKHTTTID